MPASGGPSCCLFLFSSHFVKFFPFTLFHSSVSTAHLFFFWEPPDLPRIQSNLSLHLLFLMSHTAYILGHWLAMFFTLCLAAIALLLASEALTVRGLELASQALGVGKSESGEGKDERIFYFKKWMVLSRNI